MMYSVMSDPDEMAARTYERLVQQFDQIQVVVAQEPYETKPDDFGVENWRAVGARKALQHVAVLRGWGATWLSRQPSSVRDRVDEIERELELIKGTALLDGAVDLPVDAPLDPLPG